MKRRTILALSTKILCAAVLAFTVLVSSSLMAAERTLSGAVALQLLAGKDFQFKCTDNMRGYGRFENRNIAWVSYKYSSNPDELERRADAIVRVNGNELCFKSKNFDLGGEMCVPFTEKSSGIYRAGSKDEWCDIKVTGRIARD